MIFLQRLKIIVCACLLGACVAPDPHGVPVTLMGTKAHGDIATITARQGDTVYKIAQHLGVDTRALIDRNNLTPPFTLTAGQALRVPAPEIVHVAPGDTLFSIARAYGADQSELVRLNGLQPPYQLANGQELKLPSTANAVQAPTVSAVTNDAVMANDLPPVDARAPMERGAIKSEDLAPPPGAAKAPADAPPPLKTASLTPPATPVPAPAKAKPSLGTGVPHFSWPVNGSTLSDFGPKAGGRHNDGINIGAPLGSPVRTAAAGDVVYNGDKVAGFGQLILIRHSGGFSTAYAHLQNPLVKQGDRVSAGQAIAQVGKTGNVSSAQLHFEIRKGTSAVNPKSYLP